jgi:hypothetical protein
MYLRRHVAPSILPAVVISVILAAPAAAQQRPLVTQDPEAIGAGNVLLEAGLEYGKSVFFPASGLEGNLLEAPALGVVVGVSSIAEIQITGGPYRRLAVTARQPAPLAALVADQETTTSVEDLVLGTKVRLVPEGAGIPAIAFRFATRLPNASEESGIGLDTTEFYASLLAAKTVRSVRVALNAGIGILPDPLGASRQNDVLTYGLSIARAVDERLDVVGEVNGRFNTRDEDDVPVGTETLGALRAGVRYTFGSARLDGGLIVGLTSRDPSVGVTAGFTYMFKAFDVR